MRGSYERCPFAFDVQLPADYPNSPPKVHYLSTSSERLNPNLYDDGKVGDTGDISNMPSWHESTPMVLTRMARFLVCVRSKHGFETSFKS